MRVALGRSWRPNSTRMFCIAAAAALVIGVALGVARPVGHARAATACVKHSKRVVKHVKRHGKRTRVVRIRHYRTCEPVAAPESSAPAPSAPAATSPSGPTTPAPTPAPESPATTPTPEPEPEANALGVAADDHGGVKSYTLSRQTVHSGRLTVQLQNKGEDPHDMDIQRVGPAGEPLGEVVEIPKTEPGKNNSASVTVEAGAEYRMWCNLYHHAEEGMEATVKVE
jgi:plastocyanin